MQVSEASDQADSVERVVGQAISDVEPAPELDEAWDQVLGKLESWSETLVGLLPNLVAALVLVICFWLLSLVVRKLLDRGLHSTPMSAPVAGLLVTLVGFLINVGGLFIALGILGLDKTVTSLLAGVGILGIALGFAFQDIAANFIAGIILSFRRPVNPGDVVEVDGHRGTVREINLRTTVLRVPSGELIFIPNKRVFENAILNYSHQGTRRVEVGVGVAYDSDLSVVENLVIEAIESLARRRTEEPIEVLFREFGDSSINLAVRFWVGYQRAKDELEAESAAIKAIKRAFDEGGITIPFPIRTLDLSSPGGSLRVVSESPSDDPRP